MTSTAASLITDSDPAVVRVELASTKVVLFVEGIVDDIGGQIVFAAVESALGMCAHDDLEGIEIDLSAVKQCAATGSKWLTACVALGAERSCPVQFRFGIGGTTLMSS